MAFTLDFCINNMLLNSVFFKRCLYMHYRYCYCIHYLANYNRTEEQTESDPDDYYFIINFITNCFIS